MSEWKSENGSRKPCALSRHGNKKGAEKRFNWVVCDLQKNPKRSTNHINFHHSISIHSVAMLLIPEAPHHLQSLQSLIN